MFRWRDRRPLVPACSGGAPNGTASARHHFARIGELGVPKLIEVSPVDEWAHFADGNSGEGAEPFVGGAWQTFFFPVDVQSLAMGHDFLLCVRQRLGEVG